MHSDPGFLPDKLCRRISALPWVEGCTVRLHEEGFHLSGIVLLDNASLSAAQAQEIRQLARDLHWRLDQVDVSPEPGSESNGPGSNGVRVTFPQRGRAVRRESREK